MSNRPEDDDPREGIREGLSGRGPHERDRDRIQEGRPEPQGAGPPPFRPRDDDYGDRSRRPDRDRRPDDGYSGIIPYRNPLALTGYYLSFFSIIVILGGCVLAGMTAGPAGPNPIITFGMVYGAGGITSLLSIIFGSMGLSRTKTGKGTAHCIVAIVLGSLVLIGLIVMTIIGVAFIAGGRR